MCWSAGATASSLCCRGGLTGWARRPWTAGAMRWRCYTVGRPPCSTLRCRTAATHSILSPCRLDVRGQAKSRTRKDPSKGRRPGPLQMFVCDTVVRLQAGLRHYVFTFIDPNSRSAVAFAIPTVSSRHAAHALETLCTLLPTPPRYMLYGNGAEFLGTSTTA